MGSYLEWDQCSLGSRWPMHWGWFVERRADECVLGVVGCELLANDDG